MLGDTITAVIEAFKDQLEHNLDLLERAVVDNDNEQVRLFAHSIQGSASNFGASRLVEISRQLEYQAKAGDLSEAVSKLDLMRLEKIQVLQVLNQYNGHGSQQHT